MRKFISALFACTALAWAAPGSARAQLDLTTVSSAADPVTKLPGDRWISLATALVNGRAVLGKPEVFLVNATGQELISVTCDGKWSLVGPKPYLPDNPTNLPAWKVTLAGTKGFDGYCRQGLVGQSDTGAIYKGALISSDGTFSNATFITFYRPTN